MTKIYEEIPATQLKITKNIALYCCSFEYLSYFVYTPLDSPRNNRQNRYRRTDYTDAAEFFFSVFIFERPNLISIATDVDCASIYAILLQIFMQKGLLPLTSSLSSFSVCRLSGRYVRMEHCTLPGNIYCSAFCWGLRPVPLSSEHFNRNTAGMQSKVPVMPVFILYFRYFLFRKNEENIFFWKYSNVFRFSLQVKNYFFCFKGVFEPDCLLNL